MNQRTLPDGSQQFEAPGIAKVNLRPQTTVKNVTIKLDPATLRPSQPDFELIRQIGDLCAKGPAGSAEFTFTFDPPLEVQVNYTADDEQAARTRGKPLALAYWDGQKWVRFTGLSFSQSGKFVTLELDELGDPDMGWGT